MANAASEKASATDFTSMYYLLVIDGLARDCVRRMKKRRACLKACLSAAP